MHFCREPSYNNQYGNNQQSGGSFSGNVEQLNQGTGGGGRPINIGDVDYYPGDFAVLPTISRPLTDNLSVLPKEKIACGTTVANPNPLVVFGYNTTEGEWKYNKSVIDE